MTLKAVWRTAPATARHRRVALAMATVGTVALGLTAWGYGASRASVHRTRTARFERQMEIATGALRDRLNAHDAVLRACEAFFAGSLKVEGEEWHKFVTSLEIPASVSRGAAVGYAVPDPEPTGVPGLPRFVARYVEPAGSGSSAVGADLAYDANRRSALETARDSGEAVMSGPITLPNDPQNRPAILLVRPVFGRPHYASEEDRRLALQGWVYVVTDVDEVVRGSLDAVDLTVEVFDGADDAAPERLSGRDSASVSTLRATVPFEFGHRRWNVRYTETPALRAQTSNDDPFYVLLGGLAASLLGLVITWSVATTHSRALGLAHTMTEDLRQSEEWTRALVDSMLEGLIVVSARSRIESVNPAAARIFGYECAELIGQHLGVLLPGTVGAPADESLREATRKALGRMTEWTGRRKNGEDFPFELVLSTFDTPEGRHFAGHVRDISDRRKLEQLKRDFVSTVSHELRTPLTSIRGSLGLLAGGVLGELPDEAREVAVIAERNVSRLMALINDILDLERVEQGRMEMHFESAAGGLIVESAMEAVRGMAEQQGVRIEVRACTGDVFGDAHRLIQVLVNLLSNAVKFSTRGGVVTVSCVSRRGVADFAVVDEGRGVPADLQNAIFERFQQVEASDSRDKGGTGLGLAICKAIVERHGGVIGVDSEPGRGSRFWFQIPDQRGADAFLAASQPNGNTHTDVLLVDDDEALLGVMARQLMMESLSVRTATTGAAAVQMARECQPLVIVLDVGLPEGDGYQVVRSLRQDAALRATPLVVYTIHDLGVEQRSHLRLGPTRFLTKSRATDEEFKATVLGMLPIAVGRAS